MELRQWSHDGGDSIHLILCRYFEAHPLAVTRDSDFRPVCPGPLYINNCLWRYVKTTEPRRVLRNRDGSPSLTYLRQVHLFGQTPGEQNRTYIQDCNAYYTFIYVDNIKAQANISPLFKGKTAMMDDD